MRGGVSRIVDRRTGEKLKLFEHAITAENYEETDFSGSSEITRYAIVKLKRNAVKTSIIPVFATSFILSR